MTQEQFLLASEILEVLFQPFIPLANRLRSHAATERSELFLLPSFNVPGENLR